ncbi:MAG: glutathione S-transferase [Pseudomonadota bacterium]
MEIVLHHAWSSMPAQSVRLALAFKGVAHRAEPIGADGDALFFDLGIAVSPLVLRVDGGVHTDAEEILVNLDRWTGGRPVFDGRVPLETWNVLQAWRARNAALLARLTAPVLPAFVDIGGEEGSLAAYKAEVQRRYGASVEALSNDRYEAYRQLERTGDLKGLARRLARERYFVAAEPTAADCVLACDLFPLQLLDGVTLPIDLMYYIQRVETACRASPREGLLIAA